MPLWMWERSANEAQECAEYRPNPKRGQWILSTSRVDSLIAIAGHKRQAFLQQLGMRGDWPRPSRGGEKADVRSVSLSVLKTGSECPSLQASIPFPVLLGSARGRPGERRFRERLLPTIQVFGPCARTVRTSRRSTPRSAGRRC